jgi:hypothetical protein
MQSSLLELALVEADLPELRLSSRSFERFVNDLKFASRIPAAVPAAPLPTLFCLHAYLGAKGALIWTRSGSHCFWVRDGVIVQREPWPAGEGVCSLACFLSAEGLPADLTTLALLETAERTRRKRVAALALSGMLASLNDSAMSQWVNEKVEEKRRQSLWMIAGGLLFLVMPPLGLPLLFVGGIEHWMKGQFADLGKEFTEHLAAMRQHWSVMAKDA